MVSVPKEPLVSTIKERCKVCYTCVRECPAKAIKISGGQAEVIAERCIGCGNCVRVCSQHAKRVANSTEDVLTLLNAPGKVAAVIAPSFPAEFTDVPYKKLVGMLKKLGFDYVNEVGFGADLVSDRYRRMFENKEPMHFISTACPAVVGYIERFHPDLVSSLSPLVSPMVADARALRAFLGRQLRIVFIGPCIAKKEEATHSEIENEVDEVLTFTELRQLFAEKNIAQKDVAEHDFDQPHAGKGALFAISRGLLQAADITEDLVTENVVAADGRREFVDAIKEFEKGHLKTDLLEILSCPGCIMGAGIDNDLTLFSRRARVSEYVKCRMKEFDAGIWEENMEKLKDLDLTRTYSARDQRWNIPDEAEVTAAMERMGKYSKEDELNCGACGYETCREHALAICRGLAENEMCLPYTIEKLKQTIEALDVSKEHLDSTQDILAHTEKMQNIGHLTTQLVNDFNNPLGVITMYARMLMDENSDNTSLKKDLKVIADQADRCTNVVSKLLTYPAQRKLSKESVNIKELMDRAIMAISIPDTITIIFDHQIDNAMVELDRDQIIQVVGNVITNSIQAMPNGGTLTIRTTGNNKHVCVAISDTGVGIKANQLNRIFEPFFTTKQIGTGGGLGLTVSYNIVKMHHGDIRIESNADPASGPTGSTVTVLLPREGEERVDMNGVTMTKTKKTILVVDDDEDFLFQMKLQLEKAGFDVETADGQAEAEKRLEDIEPDLVICDLMMEHRDGGFVLSYHIKKKNPQTPVIMVTAVTSETGLEFDAATNEERAWVKADVVLKKPVRFEQLKREINRLLGE